MVGTANLTILDLGYNQISDIDISALGGMTSLTGLYLDGNQIIPSWDSVNIKPKK